MHEGLSGPLPEVNLDPATIVEQARAKQKAAEKELAEVSQELDKKITGLSEVRSDAGATSSPGPVLNASTLSGVIIAALAVGGVILTQEEADALELILAALVPVVVNVIAGYQARQKVTPVK